MVDFTGLARVAERLVEENGREVTLYRRNRDAADASKPWRGPADTPSSGAGGAVIGPLLLCFVPPSGSGFGKELFGDEQLLRNADQIGLLAAKSVTDAGFTATDIETADSVVDGSDSWRILRVAHLRPASTSLLFAVALSR